MSAMAPASGLLNVDRRLFGASPRPGYATDPASDSNGTLPYIGVGYSSLASRSGWSFSADLGWSRSPRATPCASGGCSAAARTSTTSSAT
jgi:hypothetical protein